MLTSFSSVPGGMKKVVDTPNGPIDVDDDDLVYELSDVIGSLEQNLNDAIDAARNSALRIASKMTPEQQVRFNSHMNEVFATVQSSVNVAVLKIDLNI